MFDRVIKKLPCHSCSLANLVNRLRINLIKNNKAPAKLYDMDKNEPDVGVRKLSVMTSFAQKIKKKFNPLSTEC